MFRIQEIVVTTPAQDANISEFQNNIFRGDWKTEQILSNQGNDRHYQSATRQAMYVSRTNDKCSQNHTTVAVEKQQVLRISVCACVWVQWAGVCLERVALLIQNATRRHIAILALPGSTMFFDFIS
jgi:hypothetical protein